jgi:sugar phosphate isomerase/epimerase
MPDRREFVFFLAAMPAARRPLMELCIHQTTSLAAGYRKSLEGYARAGIRLVELIPPHVDEFVGREGVPAARRLLADLGLKAVSSGGVRGLAEPGPQRQKAIEELRRRVAITAALGVDRLVCPSIATEKYVLDDYRRAAENLREAGEIARASGVVLMPEFSRGSTFIGTLPTVLRVTRETNHPNVKPMFDFYHFWAGLSKFEDLGLIRAGEIHHVHFQDVPAIPRELLDSTTREIPGDGVAPLEGMLGGLKEAGYTGPLSVELFYPRIQTGDPYEVASAIVRNARPILVKAGVA